MRCENDALCCGYSGNRLERFLRWVFGWFLNALTIEVFIDPFSIFKAPAKVSAKGRNPATERPPERHEEFNGQSLVHPTR